MVKRRRINPRLHRRKQTLAIVQIIMLALILFMVLFFRGAAGKATSAFVGAFGPGEDLQVRPNKPGTSDKLDSPAQDANNPGQPPQGLPEDLIQPQPSKTSDK